jgi:glycine cleavage system H protein
MNTPSNLKYSKSHEWALIEGGTAAVGITDYAQQQLGDIVFVELPEEGAAVSKDGKLGVVESVKAASDITSPLSGRVAARNTALESAPETINKDPYGAGWVAKIALSNPGEAADLMDAAAYDRFCAEESH